MKALMLLAVTAALALVLIAVVVAADGPATSDVVAADGPATSDVVAAEGPVPSAAVPEQADVTVQSTVPEQADVTVQSTMPEQADVPQADQVLETDVFIWDTTAQGIGALRAMQLAGGLYGQGELVIASSSSQIAAMSAQGLSVEDMYSQGTDNFTSGFWGEFRRGILREYRSRGIYALTPGGRLVVEPEVVQRAFRWYIDYNGRGREGTTYLWAHVISAHYESGNHWVLLRTQQGTRVLVRPKLLIDASVEGDLARMLGAHYRFGLSEKIYGPETGPPPAPAGDAPDTWIQRVSVLLTLKVYPAVAPIIASGNYYGYSPSLYANYIPWKSQDNLRKFATSWSMTYVLPNGKRELNEAWSDYSLDIKLPHSYIFGYDSDPLIRQDLRNRIIQYAVDKVRYLQEHGYSHVGIATVPNRIYLREGIRVVGRDTYTAQDVEEERARQTVAFGFYALYDVHLPIIQNHNGAFVHVPMGSLISAEMPDLLIPGPISTDHRAYNSAVRMEPLRANYGGAAGIIAAIALGRGVSAGEVAYPAVKNELLRQGYRLAF